MASKQVGVWLEPEADAKLVALSRQMGWTKSQTVRELLKQATVEHRPLVSVRLTEAAKRDPQSAEVGDED